MSDLLKRNLRRSLEAASNCWKLLQNFNRRITIAICHRALTLITPRPLCQFNRIMNVTRFEKCHRTFGITEQSIASIPILCYEIQPLSLLPTCLADLLTNIPYSPNRCHAIPFLKICRPSYFGRVLTLFARAVRPQHAGTPLMKIPAGYCECGSHIAPLSPNTSPDYDGVFICATSVKCVSSGDNIQ